MFPTVGEASRENSYAAPTSPKASSGSKLSASGSLYPSLSDAMADGGGEEEDILAALGIPQAKPKAGNKPARPPPPGRSSTMPADMVMLQLAS